MNGVARGFDEREEWSNYEMNNYFGYFCNFLLT